MEYSNVEIVFLNTVIATYSLKTPANFTQKQQLIDFIDQEWLVFETKEQFVVTKMSEIRTLTFFNGELWKR